MFWNYLTIIYICWETITDMKTHIIALLLLRGRVLTPLGLVKQLNINAINKDNLFVALVFYGVVWCGLFV